jgi:hypothetical protein
MRDLIGQNLGLKSITISVCLLLNLIGLAYVQANEAPGTDKFEKSFDFSPGGRVEVRAVPAGNINVLGWPKASVKIEATKFIEGGTAAQTTDLMKKIDVQARHNEVEAVITASAALPKDVPWRVDYTIYVPADKMDLNIVVANGKVTAAGINGWVSITVGGGDIDVNDLRGQLIAYTKKGNVHVTLTGSRWDGNELSASTGTGNVTVEIPKKYAARVMADTKDGKIYAEYPPPIIDGREVRLIPGVKKKASWLNFPLQGGGPPIKAHSDVGDIHIVEKK